MYNGSSYNIVRQFARLMVKFGIASNFIDMWGFSDRFDFDNRIVSFSDFWRYRKVRIEHEKQRFILRLLLQSHLLVQELMPVQQKSNYQYPSACLIDSS